MASEERPPQQERPPGWYPAELDGLRFWDGDRWTEHRAPEIELDPEPIAKTVVWALSLGFGVAGVLAWEAPVIAFYWPLGLGGGSLALAVAASGLRGPTPWFGRVAVVVAVIALLMGLSGMSDLQEAREGLDSLEFP